MHKTIRESIRELTCDRLECTYTSRSGSPEYSELRVCRIQYKGYEARYDLCQEHYIELMGMFPHCEGFRGSQCYNPITVNAEFGSFCNDCYNSIDSI